MMQPCFIKARSPVAFRVGFSKVGVAASALCAVHCAALPLVAGAATTVHDSPLHSPMVEGTLIGAAALVGYGTLIAGYRHHRRPIPLVLLTLGLALLLGAHSVLPEQFSIAGSLAGAALLIGAQFLNRRCPAPCCASGLHKHG